MGAIRDIKEVAPDYLLSQWGDDRLYEASVVGDDGKTYSGYVAVDISDSKIHEYFGLADNINYLVIADLSASEEYMDNFYKLLYEIEGE